MTETVGPGGSTDSGGVPRLSEALKSLYWSKKNKEIDGNPDNGGTSRTLEALKDEFRRLAPDHPKIEDYFRILDQVSRQLVTVTQEQDSPDLVDNASLSLLQILRKNKGSLSPDERNKMILVFGPIEKNLLRKVVSVITDLKMAVGEQEFRNATTAVDPLVLDNSKPKKGKGGFEFATSSESAKASNRDNRTTLFGESFKVHSPHRSRRIDFEERKMEVAVYQDELREFDGVVMAQQVGKDDLGRETGKRWTLTLPALLEELGAMFADISTVSESLFASLSSDRRSDEIQAELVDLLGFDRFDLLGQILQNRKALVKEFKNQGGFAFYAAPTQGATAAEGFSGQGFAALSKPKAPPQPKYGQQITIQSQKEKKLAKAMKKEEKKMDKLIQKLGPMVDEVHAQDFMDVDKIRQMELDLEQAQEDPWSTSSAASMHVAYNQQIASYPYIFDAAAEKGNSRAVVGGDKVVLPENAKRTASRGYEEVYIPPSSAPPVNVGRERVKVSEMDELCQKAFQGMKSLNQIQTVVFKQAYGTNENMLVCAPTGAGKTNIAMLCVMKVVRDFYSHGRIHKDDFKIIYVAPMKALAAEMVKNFGKRLSSLGVVVKELTGDVQLSKREIAETQMIVTTPEKWDVITRKSTGDLDLVQKVRLLIIDEVHLLHDDRGPVIETLVARTLRQVEQRQNMIRILGLSATLPNYIDVSTFLNVNPYKGLFFFDGRFRPVPLGQTFIGVKGPNAMAQVQEMDRVCYDKVKKYVKEGYQVLVFVHARNATGKIATVMKEMAASQGDREIFLPENDSRAYGTAQSAVSRSKNRQVQDLFPAGFGIHHAGMLRPDRTLVERLFAENHIKVLCCTATLAWGVNLPAHAVIIRGTEIYDAKHGSFVDLGILDVQQIFGRAGRPQFDTRGEGIIITSQSKISKYLTLLTRQLPIESQFMHRITDNLNAEVVLGTVSSVDEAVEWLRYTYLYVRALINPLAYGLTAKMREADPDLFKFRKDLIHAAALKLAQYNMMKYDLESGNFMATDFGRIASHYYIKCDTVELLLKGDGTVKLNPIMPHNKIFDLVSKAHEFTELKVRDEEMEELDELVSESCHLPVAGGHENLFGKVNVLLQSHISKRFISSFSLVSDSGYVVQNAARILRALFEISLRNSWANSTAGLLQISKSVDKQMWPNEHPLWQFTRYNRLYVSEMEKVQSRRLTIEYLREADAKDLDVQLRARGAAIKECAWMLPWLDVQANVTPITNTVLRINLEIVGHFDWVDSVHGKGMEPFWVWIENPDDNFIYHNEYFLLHRKQVLKGEVQQLSFAIPVMEEKLPSHYIVRWMSDRWVGSESQIPISFQGIVLPDSHKPHTDLLTLQPLPVSALGDESLESAYPFKYFNPVQTQIFHTLYHTDSNALVGAPTGSGKTVAAELAIFRVFREYPKKKSVYIAPLKALVKERMRDWKNRLGRLGKKIVELTGDFTPDIEAIRQSDLIITTPEKWDGISRSWQNRPYVTQVALIVIDEIHLLGEDRGPVLEVLVARTNFISSLTGQRVRVVGLSTALANAGDVASWLGIGEAGMFNFRPSVRPVPTEVHISGFAGKHYCPRMATMNKPAFIAIKNHSPEKPILIFVSSRRQTRLTALDLIALLAAESNPRKWLKCDPSQIDAVCESIRDQNLKLSLAFGIGIHHAGLHESDRSKVEELFANQLIQVLIATATLAWGVNFPAHLVIVKGTEIYDGKTRRYVDMPVTDVLQMVGRAGRPQFDDHGVAVVFVQDVKKPFYKKFLYEPFPVESNLLKVMADHLNAEIVAGTITSKSEVANYLTWTYLFRRLLKNPSFYNLEMESTESLSVNKFVTGIVDQNIFILEQSGCIYVEEDMRTLKPTVMGTIASFYYLQHTTVKFLKDELKASMTTEEILKALTEVSEYDEIPVRHNEDETNRELAKICPLPVDPNTFDNAHTKTHLLYQIHFSRLPLPVSDYDTDRKSVIDQSVRILQAMLDWSAENGWLATSLRIIQFIQMIYQGRWATDPPLSTLPHLTPHTCRAFQSMETIPQVQDAAFKDSGFLQKSLHPTLTASEISDIEKVLRDIPRLNVALSLRGWWETSKAEENRPISLSTSDRRTRPEWMEVHADQDYLLCMTLSRINRRSEKRARTPRYHKFKEEGWILVLGNAETGELLGLKRVGGFDGRPMRTRLNFRTPTDSSSFRIQLYILSDCYLGVDHQYEVPLQLLPQSIQSQVNSEVEAV